jgi:type VI secretion system secreted protein Hcp
VQFQDIHFTAKTSKASPKLMLACASGEHIKDAVLVGELSGKRGQKFLEIKLTDVLISSYQSGGSGGNIPTDSFSLNFAKIEFSYFPMNRDGSLGEPVTGGWDIKENKEV